MATYTIDGNDLETLGFEVEKIEGYESIPGRKGECFQSWDDSDSIEPFVDADDILLKEREITISLHLVATSTADAENKILALENILYATGNRTLAMSFLSYSFICYCKDGVQGLRKTNLVSAVLAYSLKIVLIELNPGI